MIIYALAVWRLAHMLMNEAGPGDVLGRARRVLGAEAPGPIVPGSIRDLLSCLWCMSIWSAAILLLVSRRTAAPVTILAASATAVLIEEVRASRHDLAR